MFGGWEVLRLRGLVAGRVSGWEDGRQGEWQDGRRGGMIEHFYFCELLTSSLGSHCRDPTPPYRWMSDFHPMVGWLIFF